MENQTFRSIGDVDDINTLDEYQVARKAGLSEEDALKAVSKFSRDNARTPMQWSDEENAGFTTGTPWLRLNENYKKINAASQMEDENSVRSFYKKLIALRKAPEYKETIVYGELEPVWEDVHNLMAYYRRGDKTILVVGNYQREPQAITLETPYKKVLLNNYDQMDAQGNIVTMKGYQVLVFEM
jgi:oligo-1,6-glucosidase